MSQNYEERYSDSSFWEKIKNDAAKAGKDIVEKALTLYFCMRDSDTPAWAKTIIIGSLSYFIVPTDAIPDFTPAIGYTDDLGTIGAALAIVAAHIKQEHQDRATEKIEIWFG